MRETLVIPWSYSFLNDFTNCRRKAWHKFIARDLPKEDTPALSEGIRIHRELEHYLNGRAHTMPAPPQYVQLAAPMAARGAIAEVALGMTADRGGASFWRAPWGRGKLDVLIRDGSTAVIFDWKTGKEREDPRELFCQSLLLQANYPEVTKVTGAYVWLAQAKLGQVYDLTDVDRSYNANVAIMHEVAELPPEEEWEPTPNPLCGWCPCKGCEYNRS